MKPGVGSINLILIEFMNNRQLVWMFNQGYSLDTISRVSMPRFLFSSTNSKKKKKINTCIWRDKCERSDPLNESRPYLIVNTISSFHGLKPVNIV